MDDGMLRDRYQRLTERRGRDSGQPRVPLETIEALVDGRLAGAARLDALDQVLADPQARTEYEFLSEIAAARPRPAARSRTWLLAAAVLVMVGGGLVWRASSPSGPEPLRGPDSPVELVGPADGGSLVAGDLLVWRPVTGAEGYLVQVVTPEGEVAFRAETRDTTAVLSGTPEKPLPNGPAQWWVIARLGRTGELRSNPRRVTLGR